MPGKQVVRELITLWGFDVDTKALEEVDKGINAIKTSLKTLAASVAVSATGIGFLLKQAGEDEQVRIAFETMLGSADAAIKKLDELKQFAVKTPFTLPGIKRNAKLLLAMGIETEKLLPTMKFLGDVAAGLSVPLQRLALNFGQVRNQNKLTGREMRDFAIAGVPLLDELAKNLGKTTAEIRDMVSRGEIGFKDVEDAFVSLTEKSGRFANLMAKQAKSLFGILSNIKDFLLVLSIDLGNELLPVAKEVAGGFLEFLEINREIINQDMGKFIKNLAKFLRDTLGIIKAIFKSMTGVVKIFGGWNSVIEKTMFLLSAFTALNLLRAVGLLTQGVWGLAIAWQGMGNSALIAQAKMALIPIAIGAIITSIALLAEDLFAFSEGRKSVFGQLVEGFSGGLSKIRENFGILADVAEFLAAVVLTPLRAVLRIVQSIGTAIDAIKGKISGFEARSKVAANIKDIFVPRGGQGLASLAGFAQNASDATSVMSANNNPITGLGGAPFRTQEQAIQKATTVNAKNEITLNLEGMPANDAKDLVTETLTGELENMLRETFRDGKNEIER